MHCNLAERNILKIISSTTFIHTSSTMILTSFMWSPDMCLKLLCFSYCAQLSSSMLIHQMLFQAGLSYKFVSTKFTWGLINHLLILDAPKTSFAFKTCKESSKQVRTHKIFIKAFMKLPAMCQQLQIGFCSGSTNFTLIHAE